MSGDLWSLSDQKSPGILCVGTTCEVIDGRTGHWQAAAMTAHASSQPTGSVRAGGHDRSGAGGRQHAEARGAPLAGTLRRMAFGRIALGAASLAVPGALARGLGVADSPPLTYMTRIYGARAIALGAGYLTAPATERQRWQRIALLVDASDTAAGLRQLLRRESPPRSALPLVGLTGAYLALGAARLARDVRAAV